MYFNPIGSRTTVELLSAGFGVVLVDDFPTSLNHFNPP